MTETHAEDPEVIELVSRVLESRESGVLRSVAEICGERPDLVPAVERALRVADRMPAVHRAAEDFDPLVGTLLANRYRLLEQIGAGSMGFVYRGHDDELNRNVAVKVMRSDLFGGPAAEARFHREAEVLAAVQHRAVVAVHDRGRTEQGLMFLVMELIDGVPLDHVLHEGEARRVTTGSANHIRDTSWIRELLGDAAQLESGYVRQCVRWIAQLTAGLEAAHCAGVIHRDVKPSNVIIRRDGSPVLIDFGIAAVDAEATIASGNRIVGTPSYMAPERLDDTPLTPRVDVYGLCATLYYALTLTPPYRGTSEQVLARLASRDPKPAHQLRTDLPRDLRAILDTGMERDVARRYASADALGGDLNALLEHRPVTVRPTHALGRTWRRVRRSREFWIAAALTISGTAYFAGDAWLDARRAERTAAWMSAWAGVPPTLCTAPATMRSIADQDALARERARLDRLVELSDRPLPARALRAAFRFDQGDRPGAAADFTAILARHDTAVTRSLAARYAEVDEVGVQVRTDELPAPTTGEDRYLAALHLVRNARGHRGAIGLARELLADEQARSLHFAVELDLMLAVEDATKLHASERVEAFRALHVAAIRAEQAIGSPTGSTYLVIGVALLGMERNSEAIDPLRTGVQLAPSDHSLRINYARALRFVREPEAAREQLAYAIALRPESVGAYRNLADLLAKQGDYEAAEQVIDAAPYPEGARARHRLRANVRLTRALAEFAGGDSSAASNVAASAASEFDLAGESERSDKRLLCRALIDEEFGPILTHLIEDLATSPLEWRRIETVAWLLPDDLDPDHSDAIRRYLLMLARHLAPTTESPPSPESPSRDTK